MSELIRPMFHETEDVHEIMRQREMAAAYMGEVSVALCQANTEYNDIILTLINLNMKLRANGVHDK